MAQKVNLSFAGCSGNFTNLGPLAAGVLCRITWLRGLTGGVHISSLGLDAETNSVAVTLSSYSASAAALLRGISGRRDREADVPRVLRESGPSRIAVAGMPLRELAAPNDSVAEKDRDSWQRWA